MQRVIAILDDDPRRVEAMKQVLGEIGSEYEHRLFDNAPEMIDWLQEARADAGIVINPAAFSVPADPIDVERNVIYHRGVLETGIARVDSIGGTAMRDAIDVAEAYLHEHATRDRKVLLLITDGNDNASVTSVDRLRKQAEQNDIAIYAMGLLKGGESAKTKRAHDELDDLTERTGGYVHYPPSIDAIDASALAIARQIRSQYTLGYAPLNQVLDGSYRKLRVEVKAPEHLSVRTRAGYRATPDGAARTKP